MATKIPHDWPKKIRIAASNAKTVAERKELAERIQDMLRREDPMGLRLRGLDAERRAMIYARQIDAQLRAA